MRVKHKRVFTRDDRVIHTLSTVSHAHNTPALLTKAGSSMIGESPEVRQQVVCEAEGQAGVNERQTGSWGRRWGRQWRPVPAF